MSFPSYRAFHLAVNDGQEPLPWQVRLAERAATADWPTEIGVPTGLGKSTCVDIAVWALASQAHLPPRERTAATRTWYVVNRRLLVDAAFERAQRLATLLRGALAESTPDGSASGVIQVVASSLATLAAVPAEHGPLQVTRLRGGHGLGPRPLDPSQPALVFATVPMFASRWLFRGYGSSRSMRPIDAALAGTDSIVLLDEAHLARPLVRLGEQLGEVDPGDPSLVLPASRSRPKLVALTATGDDPSRFDLDDDDLANPVVVKRLDATKQLGLVESSRKTLVKDLVSATAAAHERGVNQAVVVFVNDPRTAGELAQGLREGADGETVVLTGLMREREAAQARARILDPATGVPAGRSPSRHAPLTAIATQTLEVGADVDFDQMVTVTAGSRALVQRLGRLNRLGERPLATVTVVHPTDMTADGLYGGEPAAVWARLCALTPDEGDLCPRMVSERLGPPLDQPERTGEMLPNHLWEFAKTSSPEPGEAPVEVFFDALDDIDLRVGVAWRPAPVAGRPLLPGLAEAEVVDVSITAVRQFIGDRCNGTAFVLADDGATVLEVESDVLRPGSRVLIPCDAGGYSPDGWAPDAPSVVLNAATLDSGILVLSAIELAAACAGNDVVALTEGMTATDDEGVPEFALPVKEVLEVLKSRLADLEGHPWLHETEWTGLVAGFTRVELSPTGELVLSSPPSAGQEAERVRVSVDAFDDLSFNARSVTLADHLGTVGELAERIGERLGLQPALVEAVRAAAAAHDLGKLDPRFQRWLDPDAQCNEAVAKSRFNPFRAEQRRASAGWPKGGRHEAVSGLLLAKAGPVDELVQHLVVSHHGHGRPMLPTVDDPYPVTFIARVGDDDLEVTADLSIPDWNQPARFRHLCERYGVWGLALLEAIVRQADHVASAAVEVR